MQTNLRCRPLHREPGARLGAVLVVDDDAGQPEVCHLQCNVIMFIGINGLKPELLMIIIVGPDRPLLLAIGRYLP